MESIYNENSSDRSVYKSYPELLPDYYIKGNVKITPIPIQTLRDSSMYDVSISSLFYDDIKEYFKDTIKDTFKDTFKDTIKDNLNKNMFIVNSYLIIICFILIIILYCIYYLSVYF